MSFPDNRSTKADFAELAKALRERLNAIADHDHRDRDPAAHLQRLVNASNRIEMLATARTDRPLGPELRHYLERRSYSKALAWIEENIPGETPEARPRLS